jgi:hypothetical protein
MSTCLGRSTGACAQSHQRVTGRISEAPSTRSRIASLSEWGTTLNGTAFALSAQGQVSAYMVVTPGGEYSMVRAAGKTMNLRTLWTFLRLVENEIARHGRSPCAVVTPTNPRALVIVAYLLRRGYRIPSSRSPSVSEQLPHAASLLSRRCPVELFRQADA